ncbi:hypothetical protein TNCV_4811671 [Trichonephila clavipes]|nr:hypothetical protein TNCV_4811671 [Trichonephila clavipes]
MRGNPHFRFSPFVILGLQPKMVFFLKKRVRRNFLKHPYGPQPGCQVAKNDANLAISKIYTKELFVVSVAQRQRARSLNPKVTSSSSAGVDRFFSGCLSRRHACHMSMWHVKYPLSVSLVLVLSAKFNRGKHSASSESLNLNKFERPNLVASATTRWCHHKTTLTFGRLSICSSFENTENWRTILGVRPRQSPRRPSQQCQLKWRLPDAISKD